VGLKWRATLTVEFEMEDGQPEGLARTVLTPEVGKFRNGIEVGERVGRTGVMHDSARVEIVSQGPVADGE
jgi:hypothetical protein